MIRRLLAGALLLAAAAVQADELGRLFFTPERRAALDRQRRLNLPDSQPMAEGETLSVGGVVQRSSGRRTTWVNGMAQHDDAGAGGVRVETDPRDPSRTRVTAGEEPPAQLRVGETINRRTRETASGVGTGTIVTPSSASARKTP